MEQAEHVLRYLKGTATEGITYSNPGPERRNVLHGWVDSDFAADKDTRRSVTGYVISINCGPVSWKAKRQACTTLRPAEAEFVAASLCGQEVIYLRAMLRGFGFEQHGPTTIFEDNASCIAMSHNPVKPEHSRHIDTRLYFLRDMVRDKVLRLEKCAGTQNVADALTKSVPGPTLAKHRAFFLGSRAHFKAHSAAVARDMSIKHLACLGCAGPVCSVLLGDGVLGVTGRRRSDTDRSSACGVTGFTASTLPGGEASMPSGSRDSDGRADAGC
eukprot:937374-Rhodomonas_salina.2